MRRTSAPPSISPNTGGAEVCLSFTWQDYSMGGGGYQSIIGNNWLVQTVPEVRNSPLNTESTGMTML